MFYRDKIKVLFHANILISNSKKALLNFTIFFISVFEKANHFLIIFDQNDMSSSLPVCAMSNTRWYLDYCQWFSFYWMPFPGFAKRH